MSALGYDPNIQLYWGYKHIEGDYFAIPWDDNSVQDVKDMQQNQFVWAVWGCFSATDKIDALEYVRKLDEGVFRTIDE